MQIQALAASILLTAAIDVAPAEAEAPRIHVGDRGTIVDIGSHLAYLHGGTPCANTLADELKFEGPDPPITPGAVLAISIVLSPGTRVAATEIRHLENSVPLRLRVLGGLHSGATCWVESDGQSVWSVRFDFEKRK
jgi:hypothetical protein